MIKNIIIKILSLNDKNKYINKFHKKSYYWYSHNHMILANFYAEKIRKKYNCYISPSAIWEENIHFPHPTGIVIGDGVIIGKNCTIYQNVTIGRKNIDKAEYPIIGDNVIIYSSSSILGNIHIGNKAIVGCNSVVLNNVNENSIVVGVVK